MGIDETSTLIDRLKSDTIWRLVGIVASSMSQLRFLDDSPRSRFCLRQITTTAESAKGKKQVDGAVGNGTGEAVPVRNEDADRDNRPDEDQSENHFELIRLVQVMHMTSLLTPKEIKADDRTVTALTEDDATQTCRQFLSRFLQQTKPESADSDGRVFDFSEILVSIDLVTQLANEISPSATFDGLDLREEMSRIETSAGSETTRTRRRASTLTRITSDSMRHSGSASASGQMEELMSQEIDDVESLPHFDRMHLSAQASTEECFELYRYLCHERNIANSDGWLNFPENPHGEGLYADWIVEVTTLVKERLEETGTCYDRILLNRGAMKPRDAHDGVECDVCLVDSDSVAPEKYKFGIMHVVGEIKSGAVPYSHNTRKEGRISRTESQLAKCVRQVFRTQPTRHYVLGFVLAGPLMRVYQFDRLGLASNDVFDVNDNPVRLIRIIVAFLRMGEVQLGYDPTIKRSGPSGSSLPFLQQQQLTLSMSNPEYANLRIERCLNRSHSVSGRGTTCWLVYKMDQLAGDKTFYLVKDSWQFTGRQEEGLMFQKAIASQTKNIASYLCHEMVSLDRSEPYNVQKHLRCMAHSRDRSNRELRRIFRYRDSKYLEKAGSSVLLLRAYYDALLGHRSLYENGIIHGDISIGNMMVNSNPSPPEVPCGFLIDLDLAIDKNAAPADSLPHMTGNRIFMAVDRLSLSERVLDGILKLERDLKNTSDSHLRAQLKAEILAMRLQYDQVDADISYANDLESFFWVLFWVCCNYDVNGKRIGQTDLNNWVWHSTHATLRHSKWEVLTTRGRAAEFLDKGIGQRQNTYKDLRPCVLLLQELFGSRAIVAHTADFYNRVPNYAAEKVDKESLYLRMLAIVEQELQRLEGQE